MEIVSLLIDSNLTNKNSNINLKTSNLKVYELYDSIKSYQLKTDKIILSDKELNFDIRKWYC